MRRVMRLPAYVQIEYKKHMDSLADKSSFRNPTMVWKMKDGQPSRPPYNKDGYYNKEGGHYNKDGGHHHKDNYHKDGGKGKLSSRTLSFHYLIFKKILRSFNYVVVS